jgi:APA family basic amino acid/polyamine antiporter
MTRGGSAPPSFAVPEPAGATPARRPLGLWTTTALVVGNMVGSGIFLLPASLRAYGGVSLVGWAFSSAGAFCLALVFAWLARAVPGSGGPYAYTRAGLGDFPGFLVAWGYWTSFLPGNAAIAVAMVGYLAFFVPVLATVPALGALAALAAIWLLVWVNTRGIREAGGVQLATTVLKLVPLVAIGVAGLAVFDVSHLVPFNASGQSTLSAVSSTAALTMWAFLGLESATIPAGEVERPERTIPLATVLGTAVTAVVYIAGTVAVMGVVEPESLARSTAPFADAASALFGRWAAAIVAAGAVVSCFGALNGWTLLLGQMPAAAAADELMPRIFDRRSRRGTPAAGLVISSLLVTLIVAANYTRGLVGAFTFLILLATLGTLVPYAFSMIAFVLLGRRHSRRVPALQMLVALLALAYSLWAMVSVGVETLVWGAVLLLAGVPVYLRMVRGRDRLKASPKGIDSVG